MLTKMKSLKDKLGTVKLQDEKKVKGVKKDKKVEKK